MAEKCDGVSLPTLVNYFFGNQRMNIKHLSHKCMRYIISIKVLLVCWFFVCLVSGLFKYLPQECGRWQSSCYWPASLESSIIITSVGNLYKNKLTIDMKVHFKGDVPGGQFVQILFSRGEAKLRILIFCWPRISYLFININQLDALNFIITLFQASTCF